MSSNMVAVHVVRSTDPKDAQPNSAQNVKTRGSMMDGHEVFVRAAPPDGATPFGVSFGGKHTPPSDTPHLSLADF